MENKQYGIDAEEELMKIIVYEMDETKEDFYKRIKNTLNVDYFMKATDNNLNMLFKYMFLPTHGIRLSNLSVGQFINDEYGDDFYLRRELLTCEEYERNNEKQMLKS